MKLLSWRVVLPVIACAALAYWWLTPHFSDEDKAYYASVFCTLQNQHQRPDDWPAAMENVIEGSNNDYALQRQHYSSALGRKVISTWQGLDDAKRAALIAAPQTCGEQLAHLMR
ncbi:hypothetical protein ACRXLK_002111 [Cronobacter turicensis]|uniref:hypothetical protein n=1 Tax=Cronobacter turicensis TaxID=413502 RepID=UPI000CFD5DDC|nr:hypothetical protein [Cronobacter turicensis]EKM0362567.1 hypothetical protein [Cronobacter turicensis]EKM0370884.1 hypothetical protein [Cronobacter turicensis]EKM0530334.1 hypothetical protein [Cronobacter turicensis]EKM5760736.1 hypothetical protein [Cronobacter turicensis]EKM5762410.1 hypothetical protein [Cronobacter turicensis]